MRSLYQPALIGLLLALSLTACTRVTPIKEIVDHPRDYAEKEVSIRGEVKNVFSLLVIKYFTVADSTGEIAVITHRPLPKVGEKIQVTGTVKEAFSLGDKTLTLIEEPSESGQKPAAPASP